MYNSCRCNGYSRCMCKYWSLLVPSCCCWSCRSLFCCCWRGVGFLLWGEMTSQGGVCVSNCPSLRDTSRSVPRPAAPPPPPPSGDGRQLRLEICFSQGVSSSSVRPSRRNRPRNNTPIGLLFLLYYITALLFSYCKCGMVYFSDIFFPFTARAHITYFQSSLFLSGQSILFWSLLWRHNNYFFNGKGRDPSPSVNAAKRVLPSHWACIIDSLSLVTSSGKLTHFHKPILAESWLTFMSHLRCIDERGRVTRHFSPAERGDRQTAHDAHGRAGVHVECVTSLDHGPHTSLFCTHTPTSSISSVTSHSQYQ